MSSRLEVAIIGASGYSGEELCRILSLHPQVVLKAVTSRQKARQLLRDLISGFSPSSSLAFENLSPEQVATRAEVFFLALPHGVSAEYAVPLRKAGKVVIDLSADFRLKSPETYQEFYGHVHPAPELLKEAVYSLPEFHRKEISKGDLLACPGCYPTSILLALIPALRLGAIDPATIIANSLSGTSGAGKKAEEAYLFCEVNENARAYGIPKHRHLSEIEQELAFVAGHPVPITFIPHLLPLHRGMHTAITATLKPGFTAESIRAHYIDTYAVEPFIRVLSGNRLPEIKNVARTNSAEIAVQVDTRTNRCLLFSAIDNLGKGAAGQAVQSFNQRFGLPETTALAI